MRTEVREAADGTVRAVVVQGTQAQAGPFHVGVMSARVGELPRGGEGLRARLQIGIEGTAARVLVLEPGEGIDVEGIGSLDLLEIFPSEEPEATETEGPPMPGGQRSAVVLEARPVMS
ncbi:hypothetical protein [Brachybacterium nesterenkovii]|uniref:hypothetical protein n=1 Tax=Brachybacterium nesterenkovii TaxID=47847 RepID=UPI0011774DBF|nr:hypothetical protein [Brachybacterium nesterenkovii]